MNTTYHKQDFLAHKQDHDAINQIITNILPNCIGIAKRYCKSDEQANELTNKCFVNTIHHLLSSKNDEFDDSQFIKQFIICIVKTLLLQRKGILIADTTTIYVSKKMENNLFTNSEYYKTFSAEEIIQHIRKLNTLQQIIYNLSVIDDFSIQEISEMIQHSELSVKALIEKAKYNLYSSIKLMYNE